MTVTVPTALIKNSTFKTQIATAFEKMRIYSPFSTQIRARAKTIDIPTLSVSSANNHSLECKTSVGTATPGNETITIDIKSDNSVDYCESDFLSDEVGFKALIKEDILKSVMRKVNNNFAVNVLAGATAVSGTIDLTTAAEVNSFMSDIGSLARNNYFSWKPQVEHGTIVRAKYQGQPFAMCGATAFKQIQVQYDAYRLTATGKSEDYSNMFKTPTGVWVMDASGDLEDLQMIYGIAGAPVHAYREDKIEEKDRQIVTRTTAGEISGDLLAADEVIQDNWNMSAGIWNKAAVPTTTAAYVKSQLMTALA